MITRRERSADAHEIAQLVTPPPRARRTTASEVGSLLGWGVPGALLALIVVALAMNLGMLAAGSRPVLIVLMAITGAIAAAFLFRAARSLARAIAGPPPPAPPMTQAEASKVRFTDVSFPVDQAWRLIVGDDDVSWLMFRSGDRYISMYTGVTDDFFGDGEADAVGSHVRVTLIGDVAWSVASEGPPVPIVDIAPEFDEQAEELDWPLQDFAEVGREQIWDDLARRLGVGAG